MKNRKAEAIRQALEQDRISEIEQQLDLLRAEAEKQRIAYIIVLKSDEAEKEEKENKRWRAEDGHTYWFVDSDGKPMWWHEYSRNIDDFYYDTHNYFQTKEEAQKYASVIETERQLKKFADEHNGEIDWDNSNEYKYSLFYNCITNGIAIANVSALRDARVIYFSSEEIAERAIDTIGKEKIKEYLTYEW